MLTCASQTLVAGVELQIGSRGGKMKEIAFRGVGGNFSPKLRS